MQSSTERDNLLKNVIQLIKKQIPTEQRELIEAFVKRYYANVAYEDLAERTIENLAGAALSHWNFIYQRAPGESKVRIYNPTLKEHGWHSKHSIVEISHDDMPFLVDSSRLEISRHGIAVHLAIHTGGIKVQRDNKNRITKIIDSGSERTGEFTVEAPIHFEINRITDPAQLEQLRNDIERVLVDVRHVVEDWQPMLAKLQESIDDLDKHPPKLSTEEINESKLFLRWLYDNHFTLLGCRDYSFVMEKEEPALKIIPNSGLGVHRDKTTSKVYRSVSEMPVKVKELFLSPQALIIAKTNTKSTVHRDTYTDYIGIKRFNAKGELIGERRFIGLYTSSAYHDTLLNIPFLRLKVAQVFAKSGLPKNSHGGKALMDILSSFPRDDLFQASVDELTQMCLGILNMQERDNVRLFARKDIYGRYFSCLVYVPRDRYNTKLQLAMQNILEQAFGGKEISVSTLVGDSALARIHYIIHLGVKSSKEYDLKKIEQKLIAVARSWHDDLADLLRETYGEETGNDIFSNYKNAFPNSYIESYTPSVALADIKYLQQLTEKQQLELGMYQLPNQPNNNLHLKIFKLNETLSLSVVMPILESLGLSVIDEHPYKISRTDGTVIWIHDFDTTLTSVEQVDVNAVKDIFKQAFKKICFGEAENDGFNRLVLLANISWRDAALLRALSKYARQIDFKFSQSYIETTFFRYPNITKKLIELFALRFTPEEIKQRDVKALDLEKDLLVAVEKVSSLDEDKIFRFYLALIKAITRTNFFQKDKDNQDKTYFSFKFAPENIPDLPLPKPMFEIFVYSPDFEAVHLRAAKVARGGLRWSDRPEDFRTEVLGLMKAQQTKNAVIVPAGAKGGFYPKRLPKNNDRNVVMAVAISCYQNFIRGMLDITDNLKNKKIVYPTNVVRYDDDDPYLVVAADKGTATFSDIANKITTEYDFWLGDAFASGGSNGYDHKKMGITARGAWESVTRHFNRLSINIKNTDFTVVGIGDMSGDVFGNGMLLSKHIKLVGAFNHQHIFIDPHPDAQDSFKERKRLFKLPRSSWADYDAKLISKGGGIFERRAKSIPVSPEMAALFDINASQIEPNELIRALLRARVDLLWNGGIGTYVKSTQESDLQVGDKTNDALRINGAELRCKVVGEGGNLGFTQLARVEYALNNGAIYTDSLDNSGGVNCSDHEVNLKILLNDVVAHGALTLNERNELLAELTDEIAHLVLHDNYRQAQAIDLGNMRAKIAFDIYQRYINDLSDSGELNRKLEFLPDDKTLLDRKANETYLTNPELIILFAYTKILLKQALLQTDIPEDEYLSHFIQLAFPQEINKKFSDRLRHHNLRREIIVTQISNTLVNQMGCIFIYRLMDETGASAADIVRAYVAARDIFAMPQIWEEIEALDGKIDGQQQLLLMLRLTQILRRATRWLLNRYRHELQVVKIVNKFSSDVQSLCINLPELLPEKTKSNLDKNIKNYQKAKVPMTIATKMASIDKAYAALDIVSSAKQHHFDVAEVTKCYFMLDNELDLVWLREQITLQDAANQWDTLALAALRDQLDSLQSALAINVLQFPSSQKSLVANFNVWLKDHAPMVTRWQTIVSQLKTGSSITMMMLFVALKELSDLVSITTIKQKK